MPPSIVFQYLKATVYKIVNEYEECKMILNKNGISQKTNENGGHPESGEHFINMQEQLDVLRKDNQRLKDEIDIT